MSELWVADSFAKINLGLHVLERMPNGYHIIETGFCFIEWSDRFEVKKASKTSLNISDDSIPTDNRNLIIQALDLLRERVGLEAEFEIKVHKKIPAGAGLGGGSSNAATIMRMANKIENLGLSTDDLSELGSVLGADIPFFLQGKTGIGRKKGDEIEPLDIQPSHWIVTVFPNIHSNTAEAYQFIEPNPEPDFDLGSALNEDPEEWRYLLSNDLERSVIPRYHLIGNIKDQLYEFGAVYAAMSGSGSSVFGIFDQDFVAINAYESFHKLDFPANLTRPDFKPDLGIYIKEGG